MNAGYVRALREAGIALDESLISHVPGFDMDCGELGAHQLMSLDKPPRAVFTIADTLALGVLKALKNLGLRVPEQVALASLNDISVAGLVDPGLTTVALPARQIGLEAMKMIKDLIEGKRPESGKIILPTQLVIRESCGCQPACQGRELDR
jgi:DNA-binding LacI/PurR family transcriptional regulator